MVFLRQDQAEEIIAGNYEKFRQKKLQFESQIKPSKFRFILYHILYY